VNKQPVPDIAHIRRSLHVLFQPDDVIELRVPKGNSGTISGYYSNHDLLAQKAAELNRLYTLYVTLNRVNPALLARRANRIETRATRTTSDGDIVRRCWLPIDVDPVRPAGVSATGEEHHLALERARELAEWLVDKLGFPRPVMADSGNGGHVLFRIDLPNDEKSTQLVQEALRALDFKFSDSQVVVDAGVFNPARIWKLYGTVSRKGDHTAERPHRMARLLHVPESIEAVPAKLLRALARTLPAEPKPQRQRRDGKLDVGRWLKEQKVAVLREAEYSGRLGRGRKWLIVCPWNNHDDGAAYVIQFDSGAITAGCLHASCQGRSWHDLRDAYEPGWRERKGKRRRAKPQAKQDESARESDLASATEADQIEEAYEADDDPFRLARIVLRAMPTLKWWRSEFYVWEHPAYRLIHNEDLRARVTILVKEEFDRIAAEQAEDDQADAPKRRKVSRPLISNVFLALESLCNLQWAHEPPTWLIDDPPFPAEECLVTKTGILHLPSLVAGRPSLFPPSEDLFTTNFVDYEFDPAATCPLWQQFLNQLWADDPSSISTLQEIMGYLLTPDTSQQKIFAFIGPTRSGKGTIGRVLRALVGEQNVAAPSLSNLQSDFGLQPLLGKTVAVIGDARLSGRSDMATIVERLLSISGEDAQTVNRKHLPQVTTQLKVRFVLLSNELPRLADASATLPSRMILLKFTQSWLGREDKKLTSKLLAELPGILNWAIHGWHRLRQRGYFVQPESGQELIDQLNEISSPVKAFVNECCVLDSCHQVCISDLYAAWKLWCERKGKRPGTEQTFGRDLRAAVPSLEITRPRSDTDRKRHYVGIGLTVEYRRQLEEEQQRAETTKDRGSSMLW